MKLNRSFKFFFLITDIGFFIYWSLSLALLMGFNFIDPNLMYYGYGNKIIEAWNWSFFPLDIVLSIIGLLGLYIIKDQRLQKLFLLISAALTFCAGFMAISFWVFIGFFDFWWWLFNLFLCLWPIAFFMSILKNFSNFFNDIQYTP